MNKIIRVMNKFETWEEIIRKNKLIIDKLEVVNNKVVINSQFDNIESEYIHFNIKRKNEVITTVKQYFYNYSLNDLSITEDTYYEFFNIFLNETLNYKFYQKLYITYVSEEEKNIFDLNIGEPILIIEKKMTNNNQLIFKEEELSKYNKYYFQEVNHEL